MKSEEDLFEVIKDFNNIEYDKWYWLNIWTRLYVHSTKGKQKVREHKLFLEGLHDLSTEERTNFIKKLVRYTVLPLVGAWFTLSLIPFVLLLVFLIFIVILVCKGRFIYEIYEKYKGDEGIQYRKTKRGLYWLKRDIISMEELTIVREQLKKCSFECLENILFFSYQRQRTFFRWLKKLGGWVQTTIVFMTSIGIIFLIKQITIISLENIVKDINFSKIIPEVTLVVMYILIILVMLLLFLTSIHEAFKPLFRKPKLKEVTELLPKLIENELENRKSHKTTRKR